MSANSAIGDVEVYSPTPPDGTVDIRILLKDGEIPTQDIIESVYNTLNDRKIRPLTDQVFVNVPDIIEYDIEIEYYIATSNSSRVEDTKAMMEASVKEYIQWQTSKIGRDINPAMLYQFTMSAGLETINGNLYKNGPKRVNVIKPSFQRIEKTKVSRVKNVNILFKGLEDE